MLAYSSPSDPYNAYISGKPRKIMFPNIECALKTAASLPFILKIRAVSQPARSMKRITVPLIDSTRRLFASSFGVTSSLRKLVKSIRGSEMLNITFDSISFDSGVITLTFAAMAPIITTMARIMICDIMIFVSKIIKCNRQGLLAFPKIARLVLLRRRKNIL